ncbi:hypothetical protein Mpsy_0207 [Methanolobus psychrophilus R15]|nr:hypothetical protein Mpsy_0207 [Methanolobus psychrophilus R15]
MISKSIYFRRTKAIACNIAILYKFSHKYIFICCVVIKKLFMFSKYELFGKRM